MNQSFERLGRRPGAVLVLCLLAGFGGAKLGLGAWVALPLQAAGLVLLRRGASRGLQIGALLLLGSSLALLYGGLRLNSVPASDISQRVLAEQEIEASVTGRVVSVTARPEQGPRIELALESLDGAAASGRLLLNLKTASEPILWGDGVSTRALLWRVRPALLPGGWDRAESLATRGVRVEGSAGEAERIVRGPAWWRWLPVLSDRIADGLSKAAAPGWAASARWQGQHGPFLSAILLGRRDGLAPELAEAFRKSGLYHLFAISGMNLALIAAVIYGLLGRALGRRAGAAASAAAIVLYSALTVGQASVWRASLMVLVHLAGIVLGRRPDGVNSVCLAASALLLLQPALVADLGFQLTVLATVSVLLYARQIARQIRLPRPLALAFGASAAAQAAVLPLLLAHFRELSLFGLISGLLAAPPFSVALGLSMLCATLFTLGLSPDSAICQLALGGASACAALLFEVAHFFARLPGSVLLVPRLTSASVALCLALGASYLLRRTARRILGQSLLVVLLAASVLAGLRPETRPPLRITFLGVGNADCALLELPGGRNLLVDGAGDPRGKFDIGNLAVVPFLWHSGIAHIETAYLSHAHPDHALGLSAVLGGLGVDRLRLNGPIGADGLLHDLQGLSRRTGADLELINPYTDSRYPLDENDRSLVLKLGFGRLSALFAGDVEEASEHDLADTYGTSLAATVLKVAHHGSCTSSHEPFLEAVRPRLAVISLGFHNTFGHPCAAAVQRLERSLGPDRVLYTSAGSVRVSSGGADLTVERYSGRGWQRLWSEPLDEGP